MNPQKNEDFKTVLEVIQNASFLDIGHNDHLFIQRIYADGLQKYLDRLRAIGFSGNKRVLDAGCGYGQWSLALSSLNEFVESCDISPVRIRFLQELVMQLGIHNLFTSVSQIDLMPYPDCCFDAIFCYGVIFLTPWLKSLAEFSRVLRPGGKLYVNANGLGWYMFLWQEEHNKADDYDPRAVAARALSHTLRYEREKIYEPGMNLIIEPDSLEKELEVLGFVDILIGPEGSLHLDKSAASPLNFFRGDYKGQLGIYEVVATKF